MGQLATYRRVGDGVELSYRLNFDIGGTRRSIDDPRDAGSAAGRRRRNQAVFAAGSRSSGRFKGITLLVRVPKVKFLVDGASIEQQDGRSELNHTLSPAPPGWGFVSTRCRQGSDDSRGQFRLSVRRPHGTSTAEPSTAVPSTAEPSTAAKLTPESVDCVPGFDGVRLPLDRSIMPTAIAWTADGTLAFTSLKGHVYRARDTDGDGIEDRLEVVEEGLAAPYGLLADGRDLIVAHKPELLRLRDTDGDGRADVRTVLATGWGYSENYHDWTCGLVRDARGSFYVGLGSDYSQKNRSLESSRWRGKVLRIDPDGRITPIAHALRYPTGLAFDGDGPAVCHR